MTTQTRDDRSGLLVVASSLVGATLLVGVAAQLYALPSGGGGSYPLQSPAAVAAVDLGGAPLAASAAVVASARPDRGAVLKGDVGHVRVALTLRGQAPESANAPRVPTDLVVVLDTSGSMDGEKIRDARQAVAELVGMLSPQDRFALITYSDSASLDIPMSAAEPAQVADWRARVGRIEAEGSTNISEALELAGATVASARQPGRMPRVLLLSDGEATAGDTTFDGLVERARKAALREYALSAVGVGADFNEEVMTAIADAGTGNYYYLSHGGALAQVFEGEFAATRGTVASGVTVRVSPSAGAQLIDAAGYPIATDGATAMFMPGSLFAGQERQLWLTYQIPTAQLRSWELGRIEVEYTDREGGRASAAPVVLGAVTCVADRDAYLGALDKEVWSQGIVQDELARLKLEVAQAVKSGDRKGAQDRIRQFEARNQDYNAVVQSAEVEGALRSLGYIGGEVDAAFEGPGQAQKQKVLSKSYNASGWDGRRVGSKMRN